MTFGLLEWAHEVSNFLAEIGVGGEARLLRDLRKLAVQRSQLRDITKPLGEGLFELKTSFKREEYRCLYVFHESEIVVLLCFKKKSQKTPRSQLELARKRQTELKSQEMSLGKLSSIDLGLAERLRDRNFRREWFRAELEDQVPDKFRALREARELTQEELARLADMKQSAISRFEKSRDASWKLETLMKLAEALDAQLTISLTPAEDVLKKYASDEKRAARAQKPGEPAKDRVAMHAAAK